MATSGKFIFISSTNASGHTPIGINGRHRNLPHNKEVAVSDAELSLLTNSNVDFEVKGSANASDLKDAVDQDETTGVETALLNPSGQVPGGDSLTHGGADTPAVVHLAAPEVRQVPGGDNLAHGDQPGADVAAAEQDARDKAQAALDGTQEPVVVLNTEEAPLALGDQTALTSQAEAAAAAAAATGGNLAVEPFDAEKTLDRSIPKITEDFDEFDAAQVKALLKAEKAGANRSTLVEALERKAASF